jgi:hypothetical protein
MQREMKTMPRRGRPGQPFAAPMLICKRCQRLLVTRAQQKREEQRVRLTGVAKLTKQQLLGHRTHSITRQNKSRTLVAVKQEPEVSPPWLDCRRSGPYLSNILNTV